MDWAAVVEELPDAVLAFDEGGSIRFANRAAGALLGVASDDLGGRPLSAVLPARLTTIGDRPFLEHTLRHAAEPGRITAPVVFSRGGVDVEIEVDWTVYATTDRRGDARTVAVLRRRPTALDGHRPRAADEDEALRVLRLVFDHAPVGIFHFDERGVLTACNDRFVEILGSTRQRLQGLALRMLPNEHIRACIEEALAGRSARFEGDYHAVTGSRVTPVRVDFEPIVGEDGKVVGGVGLAEDVTERADAERRAASAERIGALGTLAAGVVHELQNPLATVVASLDLALRVLGDGEARTAIDRAREGAWRVATVMRDLKAFARSDEERRRPVLVHDAIESASRLAAEHLAGRAALRRDLRAKTPVRASEQRLVQLFVHLLLNAAEAIPEGDPASHAVSVSTRDEEGGVAIVVEDTGRGVPPSLRDRMFEPFVGDKPGGMGLGLAICHGIVTSLGGTITASDGVARGTRIEVRLPAALPDEPSPPPPPARTPVPPRPHARVLVVDDEERLAETIRMALSPPHEVDVTTRSRQVLEWIGEGRDWDVVLCDLMMPDMTGPELHAAVQERKPALAERFVFLTGGAFTEASRAFLHRVPNPRLEKPFDLAELEQIVDAARARGS